MPRDGATIFSDLIGKLDVVRVACDKCGRDGCYGLNRLINQRGRDAKLIDWLDEQTAECPKKIARNMNDPCGARCPGLVLAAISNCPPKSQPIVTARRPVLAAIASSQTCAE